MFSDKQFFIMLGIVAVGVFSARRAVASVFDIVDESTLATQAINPFGTADGRERAKQRFFQQQVDEGNAPDLTEYLQ